MRLIQIGPRNAKIMIVGEAPGATEDSLGVPFSGASGELLTRMLSRVGISRADCFITNVCHTKPPKNDFNWFIKPKPRPELAYGILQLKADIESIRPNLVIALGSQPLRFLCGKQGIDKWRGSILESTLVKGVKVIGTYHPAYILRVWDYKTVAEFDLTKASREAAYPEIRRPSRDLILNPTREACLTIVPELLAAEWLAVDIECWEREDGTWQLACVGFSDRPDRAVVFPCDEEWQRNYIRELCGSPVAKVLQNGTFDKTVLESEGIPLVNFKWDTMLGHHSLYAESASGSDEMAVLGGKKKSAAIQKGLAFQTSIYTDEPFYKDDGKLWKKTGDLNMFWRYNALDAAVTREIRDVQEREIADFGVGATFDHEMSLVEPLMSMTRRGIKIDTTVRDQLHKQYDEQIERLQAFLDGSVGSSINVKSSKQVQELVYGQLKLPVKVDKKSGNPTAGKDAIVELAEKYNHPILLTILKIRQRRDYQERYVNVQLDSDGRMRCAFDITGTRSGRLSSRKSIYGSGTNLQNIPARKPEGEAVKRMFIADDGKAFVYRDYSQAEARVVAYLAGSDQLIELFESPDRDIHCENAQRIFGKSTAKLIADGGDISEEERYLAKRVVHASNYGMGPKRLVELVNEDAESTGIRIDFGRARMLIDRYFLLYPEIRERYWKFVESEMRYSRILNTPFGRKRTFYGRWDDKLLREAYSYIPQSTVGDLACKAIVRCYHEIEKKIPGAELLLNVHDSVMMQCNIEDVFKIASEMERVMKIPIEIGGRTLIIPSDCKVGYNWGSRPKKTPEDNPRGLVDIKKWVA